jgi:hypothetical protein
MLRAAIADTTLMGIPIKDCQAIVLTVTSPGKFLNERRTTIMPEMNRSENPEADSFSLLAGGLLYRFMQNIGLANRTIFRAVVLSALAWFPLVVLSAVQGLAINGGVRIPLLGDYGVYGRFLIAIPLLVLAEPYINRRIQIILHQFSASKLIRSEDNSAFTSAIRIAINQNNSILAEILILALAYSLVLVQFHMVSDQSVSTWYLADSKTGKLSLAGWWYALVGIPIFQFLLFRWLWRLAVWTGLLWRISRLNLRLIPIHPDRAGGLGFLPLAQTPFSLIAFATSVVISSAILNSVIYKGTPVQPFTTAVIAYILLSVLIFIAPLFVFIKKLLHLRVYGILDYTTLGEDYADSFNEKWINQKIPEDESILGSADIQSLADLANSFDIIRGIKPMPIDYNIVIIITAAAVIPILPLIFMVLPLKEIIKRLLGLPG